MTRNAIAYLYEQYFGGSNGPAIFQGGSRPVGTRDRLGRRIVRPSAPCLGPDTVVVAAAHHSRLASCLAGRNGSENVTKCARARPQQWASSRPTISLSISRASELSELYRVMAGDVYPVASVHRP